MTDNTTPDRVRNARTGKWIDLPPPTPPGLVWARLYDPSRNIILGLVSSTALHQHFARKMEQSDRLPPKQRWHLNYCPKGEPSLKTDPPQWSNKVSPLSIDDIGL